MKKGTPGKRMKIDLSKVPTDFFAFGYTKKSGGGFTAICVNLSLFTEGSTAQEAMCRMDDAITTYLEFVVLKHPNQIDEYLNRPAPAENIEEFKHIMIEVKKAVDELQPSAPVKLPAHVSRAHIKYQPFISPFRSLAKEACAAHA